jgi:hypothetical protein
MEKVSVPIGTSRAQRMGIVLSKASVTARLKKSMLFPSPTGLMEKRLRQIVSRPDRNSLVVTGVASDVRTGLTTPT